MTTVSTTADSKKTITSIGLFDAFILFIVSTGAASILLLILNYFNAISALILGLFLTVLFSLFFKCKIVFHDQRFDLYLVLILTVALFFIAKPYLYVMGGQDQGLYINMSSTYEKTGSPFMIDRVRELLNPEQKALYDKHNHYITDVVKEDKYEGAHKLGIYIKDLAKSEYVYQFYPLHPLWMAIFAELFGEDNRVYSLVFFALLSIVNFFLLAYELSGKKKLPGYFIALFLAVNPLFAFFAKFPITEMMLVAFSSLGFYYLLRYYKGTREGENVPFYLFVSALSFLSLFFIHISGFLYIPLFYLILLLAVLFMTERRMKLRFMMYSLFVLFSYILSLWYGLVYSFPYSYDIYKIELASRLVKFHWNWKWELTIGILILILMPFLLYRGKQTIRNWVNRFWTHFFNLTSLLIFIIIPLNIYTMYKVGLEHFVLLSTSYSTMLYLTWFGSILFLGALNHQRKAHTFEHFFFLLFLLYFWIMRIYIPAQSGYHYYGARYLFSEVIVYSLLLIALYGSYLLQKNNIKRWFGALCIAGLLVYSLFFTFHQLKGQEADGSNQALTLIANQMDGSDLLFSTFQDAEIMTALQSYFDLNLFIVPKEELTQKEFISDFLDTFNDMYVLSDIPLEYPGLEIANIIAYQQGIFERPESRIPTDFFYIKKMNLYLYKILRKQFITVIRPSNYQLTNFYTDFIWTNGNGIISNLGVPVATDNKYLILKTEGHSPFANDPAQLRLQLLVNNKELKFNKQSGNDYYFEMDPSIQEITEIKIMSSTFIPKEVGINTDERQLGIDVVSIRIK